MKSSERLLAVLEVSQQVSRPGRKFENRQSSLSEQQLTGEVRLALEDAMRAINLRSKECLGLALYVERERLSDFKVGNGCEL